MIERFLALRVRDALADTPVVLVNGPRQAGKSTLVQKIAREDGRRYLTLDDAAILAAASTAPEDFLAGLEGPVVLDEVQRAPGLFRPLKASVDRDRTPGRYLLTGSADVLLLPGLSESLTGRVEILTLWPFAVAEIEGVEFSLADHLLGGEPTTTVGEDGTGARAPSGIAPILERVLAGGFAEARARRDGHRRDAWFGAYLTTVLQRDIRELSEIEGLTRIPRLLKLIATRTANLLNVADLSRGSGIPHSTLSRYLSLLEITFLVQPLPAWATNLGKRLTKSPKLMVADTGLLGHLLGVDASQLEANPTLLGPVVETFVYGEMRKQQGWARTRHELHHFRTTAGAEVDLVLEDRGGMIAGIEVKASRAVHSSDFRHLRGLAEATGASFQRGVVLYLGDERVAFGPGLEALPMRTLWGG
jgi:uncharacterized protein